MRTTRPAISMVATARYLYCVPCRGGTAAAAAAARPIMIIARPQARPRSYYHRQHQHYPISSYYYFSTNASTEGSNENPSSNSTALNTTTDDEQHEQQHQTEKGNENEDKTPEVEQYSNALQQLCKARQGAQAEDYFRRVILPHQNLLSASELHTLQNLVLWCWAKSHDSTAPQRAQQFFNNHVLVLPHHPAPTIMSYRHLLTCWSRAKKHSLAGQRAETVLRKMQSLGLKDQDQWQAYHLVLKACNQAKDGDRAIRLLKEMIHGQQQHQQHQQQESDGNNTNSDSQTQQMGLDTMTKFKMNKHILTTVLMALKTKPIQAESLLFHLQDNFGFRPDTIHYATVMVAWAQGRNGPRCEALLEKMLQKENNVVKPSIAVYNSVLHSWRSNLDRMEFLFCQMMENYLTCSFRNPSSSSHHNNNNSSNNNKQAKERPAVRPNVESLSIVLDAQAQARAPHRAEKLLAWIMNNPTHRSVIEPNVVCLSSVLNAWARNNEPAKAERLLRQMQQVGYEPNAVTFTTVLHGWALQGNVERCQALWNEMIHHHENTKPNQNTLNSYLLAHANAGQPKMAEQILEQVREQLGLSPDLVSYTTVLRAYHQAGQPQRARQLLDQMREQEKREGVEFLDVVAYNTVIQAYSKVGMAREAEELLYQMMETTNRKTQPNIRSFSQVMSAYNRSKDPSVRGVAAAKAEELWGKLDEMGLEPNLIALNVLLQCFSRSGDAERAESTLKAMVGSGSVEADLISYNTCLQAWARVRNAERAEKLLFEMVSNAENQGGKGKGRDLVIRPDVFSFSIVLSAWAKQVTPYAAEHAEAILKHMHEMGESCKPDTISYNTVIQAWLKLAKRARESCNNDDFCRIGQKCAERADSLLHEMEEFQKTPGGRRVRPDSLSYESVIKLWEMVGNRQRAEALSNRLRSVNTATKRQ